MSQDIKPGSRESGVEVAREYFDPGHKIYLPKPVNGFLVCQNHRILYAPIAKCGCTSIKRMMIALAGIPHANTLLQLPVHYITDNFQTGALLKDLEYASAIAALTSDDYYRFAVVRDPIERTISAYTEKFFVGRNKPYNAASIRDAVRTVQAKKEPDLDAGITFREFVNYITQIDPIEQDTHWRPQHLALAGVQKWDDIFTLDQMEQLTDKLTRVTSTPIDLGVHNKSLAYRGESTKLGQYVDLKPTQLETIEAVKSDDFKAPDVIELLNDYFEEDLRIYNAATRGLKNFQPRQITLPSKEEAENVQQQPLTQSQSIATYVALYSKGYVAVNAQGNGSIGVAMVNTGQRDLDFGDFKHCYLAYEPADKAGRPLAHRRLEVIDLKGLRSGETWQSALNVEIPTEVIQNTQSILVTLQLGQTMRIEDLAPLHSTSAELIRS